MNAPHSAPDALNELDAALYNISRLADALRGIGSLLQPEHTGADEQLNMARRSDASAVFAFFGEVLAGYREDAVSAHEALQRETRRASGVAFKCKCRADGGAA